jgi:uncharacterized protein
MQQLQLTMLYAAMLALLFSILTLLVVIQRRKNDVPYGDDNITPLRSAIRAHGNFVEYVPFALILLGLLEFSGFSRTTLNALFIALLAARIAHAVAMFSATGTRLYFVTRIFGAFTTWIVIIVTAVILLLSAI